MANPIEVGKITKVDDRAFPEPHFAILFPNLDADDENEMNGALIISPEFLGDSDLAEERRIRLRQVLEQLAEGF